MGSITLTNLPAFVEQPERNIVHTTAALDRMTCVLWGPYWLAAQYTPKKGSPHPEYPWMFVTGSTIKSMGALAAIEVTYAGRTDATSNNFISETLASVAVTEKEFSYQQRNTRSFTISFRSVSSGFGGAAAVSSGTLTQYQVSLASYSIRYLTNTLTIKYVTNNPQLVAPYKGNFGVGIVYQYTAFMGESAFQWVPDISNLDKIPVGIITTGLIGEQLSQITDKWFEKADSYETRWVFE
jgi:hypothetical protein